MSGDNKSYNDTKPPLIREVEIYFAEKDIDISEARNFFNYYQDKGWEFARYWKANAFRWILKLIIKKYGKH
jgi:hypothetical protein